MSDEIFDPELHATDPKTGEPRINSDGTFRKKRKDAGRRQASRSARTRTTAAKAAPDDRTRYASAVAGVLSIPTAILSMVDPVDGYCAAHYTPHLAEAIADVAVENPQVAAVVDKLAQVGPLGALLSVGVVIGVQFAHNHGKVPEAMARAMGATPRREIEAVLKQRGERLAAQARAAEGDTAQGRPAMAERAEHSYAA